MRVRRAARRIAWIVLSLVTTVAAVAIALVLAARTRAGRRWVGGVIERRLGARLQGELRIGRVTGDLTRALVVEDVELRDREGAPAVRARRVALRYDLLALARRTISIDEVTIEGAWVRARYFADGKLNLAELARPEPPPPPDERPFDFRIGHARADGIARFELLAPAPVIEGNFFLEGHASRRGDTLEAALTRLSVDSAAPARASAEISGAARLGAGRAELRDLEVRVRADGTELRRVAPRLLFHGPWRATLRARGTPESLALEASLRPPRGELRVDGELAVNPLRGILWRGRARARGLDPGAAWLGAPRGAIVLDADGRGVGRRGTVEITRLTADAAGTRARADGRLTLGAGFEADGGFDVVSRDLSLLATLGAPALSGTLALHGRVARSPLHTRVDLDLHGARLGVAAARIGRVDAHLHARDRSGSAILTASGLSTSDLRIDTLSLAASGDRRTLALQLDARGPRGQSLALRAHGVPLHAGAAATIDRLLVALHGQRWESTRPGRLRVEHRRVEGALALASGDQWLSVAGAFSFARRGDPLDVRVQGRGLDAARLAPLLFPSARAPRTALDLDAHLTGSARAPIADVRLEGTSRANGPLALPALEGRLAAHYAKARVRAALAIDGAGAGHAAPRLRATVDAPLTVDGAGPIAADLDASAVPLENFVQLLPRRLSGLRGAASLRAHVAGTTRRPLLRASLELPSWELLPLRRSRASAELDYDGAELRAHVTAQLADAAGAAGAIEISARAPLALARGGRRLPDALDGRVELRRVDLARIPLTLLGVRGPLRAGLVDGAARIGGTLRAPEVHGRVTAANLALDRVGPLGADVRFDYAAARATVDLSASLDNVQILRAHGESDLELARVTAGGAWRDAPLRVSATISRYDLGRARQLDGRPPSDRDRARPIAGVVDGTVELRGALAHPIGRVELRAPGLRAGAMDFSAASIVAAFDGARATVTLDARERAGGRLRLDADAPLDAGAPLTVRLAADRFTLDVARAGPLRVLKGRLDAHAALTGTRAHPRLDGAARLDGGEFGLASESRVYDHARLDVAVANGAVELRDAAVAIGAGRLHAAGTARLDGFTLTAVDLAAEATRLPISGGPIGAWFDAALELHGRREGEVLRGVATVTRATAHLPRLATGKKLQSTAPLADVEFTDERARAERVERERERRAAPHVELRARIPGPFHVRAPELATELRGDLDVELFGAAPRLSGAVAAKGGFIELLGRRYQVDRARAGFGGESQVDPTLDVRVSREVAGATLVIEVHGTARKPQLVLSSEPPIYDQAQVVGFIISGDPSAGRFSDASGVVFGAISGLLVNKIKDQIAPALPIDVLKIDTSADATELGSTRVEVGKYLTDRLYVSYVHQFGVTAIGTRRLNANQAEAEYRFRRRLSVNGMFGDAGQGSLDLNWTLRY